MLPSKNRLPLRFNRDRLTEEGKVYHSKHLTLVTSSGTETSPRFAIITSKKLSSKAVDRNRIKRRLAGSLGHHLPELKVADSIIIPKRSLLEISATELDSDLKALLAKADLI